MSEFIFAMLGVYIGIYRERILAALKLFLPEGFSIIPPKVRIYKHWSGRYCVKTRKGQYIGIARFRLWNEFRQEYCLGDLEECRDAAKRYMAGDEVVESY